MTLETARLRLEPLAPEHAEALRAIWSDPEVARFLIPRPASRAAARPRRLLLAGEPADLYRADASRFV